MTGPTSRIEDPQAPPPSFGEVFRVWLKIGLLSFGGPAGQIALMHRMLVEERRWIDESRFLHALNFCMLLPGPEAQQLAVYIGWLLHRVWGGVVAGVLFVLPGFFIMLGLSVAYAQFAGLALVEGLFLGIKAAVIAIVVEALLRIARRALKSRALHLLAAGAFLAIFVFAVPFPLIVLGAAAAGFLGGTYRPRWFGAGANDDVAAAEAAPPGRARQALRGAAVCLLLWVAPVVALRLALGPDNVFAREALFFSQMAVVTFGGAYAVLAYVAQQAVEVYGWLSPGEMIDGLGLAETTPGPLIMVVQFVGFLGAYRAETGLDPLLAGILGATLTSWVTFLPCFLWIFLGAPLIERLRNARALSTALSAITAAVVGVVLNLAIWFAAHVLFADVGRLELGPIDLIAPDPGTLRPLALLLTAAGLVMMFRFRLGMLPVLGVLGLAGAMASFVA